MGTEELSGLDWISLAKQLCCFGLPCRKLNDVSDVVAVSCGDVQQKLADLTPSADTETVQSSEVFQKFERDVWVSAFSLIVSLEIMRGMIACGSSLAHRTQSSEQAHILRPLHKVLKMFFISDAVVSLSGHIAVCYKYAALHESLYLYLAWAASPHCMQSELSMLCLNAQNVHHRGQAMPGEADADVAVSAMQKLRRYVFPFRTEIERLGELFKYDIKYQIRYASCKNHDSFAHSLPTACCMYVHCMPMVSSCLRTTVCRCVYNLADVCTI